MSDYVTLLGAEDVSRAGRQIDSAADTMLRAANTMDEAVSRLASLLDEHANRIEAAMMEKQTAPCADKGGVA